MGALTRAFRRTGVVAATAAAFTLAGAGIASAHHCYKDDWQAAAYQHHLKGGTAWVSLSDLGTMFLIPPELQAQCGYVADEAVAAWMAESGLTQEPLIHSKATVGGGAFYNKGKAPKPFEYLSEADFDELGGLLMAGLEGCTAGA
jgi:hypothetical protein